MDKEKILIWLPSPLGDAVLCTPALRAIRKRYSDSQITFYGNKVVRGVLEGCGYNDRWLDQSGGTFICEAKLLRKESFDCVVLFKNSFGSALSCFLAGVPCRVGYSREMRGGFLTQRLYADKLKDGRYKPNSMIDYYLTAAGWLGCDVNNRQMELVVTDEDVKGFEKKVGGKLSGQDYAVIVPGGSFGPSKFWKSERFAAVADKLADEFGFKVVVSVSPNEQERKVAKEICSAAKNELINLGEVGLSLGELKALFSRAKIVVTNDTGPRHIAIAFGVRTVTLFGPNDPAWTESGFGGEIKVVGRGDCVPCGKGKCKMQRHICMDSITSDEVFDAVRQLLDVKI